MALLDVGVWHYWMWGMAYDGVDDEDSLANSIPSPSAPSPSLACLLCLAQVPAFLPSMFWLGL